MGWIFFRPISIIHAISFAALALSRPLGLRIAVYYGFLMQARDMLFALGRCSSPEAGWKCLFGAGETPQDGVQSNHVATDGV
jgi:hypothetical protein